MNRILLSLLLFFCLPFEGAAALSRLEAISMIESGDDDTVIGGAGEISRYQIRPAVWRQYSRSTAYRSHGVSAWVADRHLEYLVNYFRARAGRLPSDYDCYVMWNGGPVYYARLGFSPRKVHPVIGERAQRFVNLRQMHLISSTRPPDSSADPGMGAVGDLSSR